VHPGFVNAVEMLPMPRAVGLPIERIEGERCVWCGGAAAFNLGPRLSTLDGTLHSWRPKGCSACTRQEGRRVFQLHIRNCARCCRTQYCPDARALHALGWPETSAQPDRRNP
jgi:hypothetical protein